MSLLQHDWLLHFFDDFFEARIATEGIPTWVKSEVAITWAAWSFGEGFKLLERQISFSHPGTNYGK